MYIIFSCLIPLDLWQLGTFSRSTFLEYFYLFIGRILKLDRKITLNLPLIISTLPKTFLETGLAIYEVFSETDRHHYDLDCRHFSSEQILELP